MKIIIAGAGQAGVGLAKYLRAENNEIVLIDSDEECLANLSEQLDIQTITGSSAYPATLEKAGAENADVLLAVTGSDETNIVACGVARSVFNVPTRIARIGSSEYLSAKYKSFFSFGCLFIRFGQFGGRTAENGGFKVSARVDFGW